MTDEDIKKTSFRLHSDLIKRLKQYALDNDTNITSALTQAIEEFLTKHKKGSNSTSGKNGVNNKK